MELNVVVPGQSANRSLTVADLVFDQPFNEDLVHQVTTAYRASLRAGTRAQKTRGEVSGGGKKPWRQKHTGRARIGSIRSPLWRKGGVSFAAKPHDYSQKINKKMYRQALRSIFSELAREKRLLVLESLKIEKPKTKLFKEQLKSVGLEQSVLLIMEPVDINVYLAARNLVGFDVVGVDEIDPVSLIKFEKIVMTPEAVKKIEEWLK